MAGGWSNSLPLSIGGRSGGNPNSFHGMIDDVRISSGALQLPALLYSTQAESEGTLGYWRFESRPDVLADSSGHGRNLLPPGTETTALSPGRAALSDFCHALFNSSEFLYIE